MISSWYSDFLSQVPEVDRAADPQAALPAPGQGDRPGLQDRPEVPELRRDGPAGGVRGLPRRPVRGHQPVRHPRQEGHHCAQGHPTGQEDPWREGLANLLALKIHFTL